MDFKQLGISQDLLEAVTAMGFKEPSPIQEKAIPHVKQGKDVIGQAQTGTGKTAAFGIPIIEGIEPGNAQSPQALIIAPTRELAVQVAEELNNIGKYKKIHAMAVYGGEPIDRQIRALKKHPHIVTATPGRLLDHIKRQTIRLNDVRTVVLDEADEMLNMGFIDDIKSILSQVPEERQTLLFSATMPDAIRHLAERFMKNPVEIKIKAKTLTVDRIDQQFIEIKERQKFDIFTRLLDIQHPERAIVFGRTKRRVDELTTALRKLGYKARGLHGDLTQSRRDQVMDDFKTHRVTILVATDVAARGLDIDDVTHVYNFDMPQDPESYVHRIGRTGRAGKQGEAITFVTTSEKYHLYQIEKSIKRKIERMEIPSREEAVDAKRKAAVDKLVRTINRSDLGSYEELAQSLLETEQPVKLIAAALKLLTHETDTRTIKLTDEKPLQMKRMSKRRPQGQGGRRPRSSHGYGNQYNGRNERGGGYRRQSRDRDRVRG
ncbi:MAG: DEAD/DEAH box helicase [Tuberibacillus sp.]